MLELLREAFAPFLWGGALALFLNLPLRCLERWLTPLLPRQARARRAASLTLLLLALAAATVLGLWLLVPQLAAAAAQLAAVLPALLDRLGGAVEQAVPQLARDTGLRSLQGAGGAGRQALGSVLGTGMEALLSAAGKAGDLAVALVLAVYLLAGKEDLLGKAGRVLQAAVGPARAAQLAAFGRRAEQVFARFVAGQCTEAAVLAGLFVLAMFLLGFPNVLPVAAVIGVTALVPVFGAFVGGAVGVVLILPYGVEKAGWFVVLFLALQQLENNLIYPRVVGSRIGLPPLWVFAAVVLGGGLFGAAGLVLGIPAVSVIYHLGRDWVRSRLAAQQSRPPKG